MTQNAAHVMIELTTPNPLRTNENGEQSTSKIITKDPEVEHRQKAMDLLRGLSVFLMVIQHVVLYFATFDLQDTAWFRWTAVGPGNVAVFFMFILGINCADPERNPAKPLFVRGLKLWGFGYLLNICRGTIPFYVSCLTKEVCPSDFGWTYLNIVFRVDIYPFVGGALVFIAFFRALEMKKNAQLAVTILLVIVLSMFDFAPPETDPTGFMGYFIIGTGVLSTFPFRSWIIFPMVGAYLGCYWRPYNKETVPMKKLNLIAIVGWIALFVPMFFVSSGFDHYGFENDDHYFKQKSNQQCVLFVPEFDCVGSFPHFDLKEPCSKANF
ncbi:hypothetical protein GEMRC1_000054 [Eukaryota sp. GEM-RC1]